MVAPVAFVHMNGVVVVLVKEIKFPALPFKVMVPVKVVVEPVVKTKV